MVDYFLFAFKNLRHRGIRSWLTLLGIFIGIMAVISLITLGNGLKVAVNSQFGISSTQVITVQAGGLSYGSPGSTVSNPLTKQDAEAIEKIGNVDFAIPRNIELLSVEYNDVVEMIYFASIISGREKEMYEIMDFEAEKGKLLSSGAGNQIVIGANLEDGEKNGFDKDIPLGKKILVGEKEYSVVGILERQGSFILDNIVLIYDEELKEIANYGDNVDIIGVKVKDKNLMNKTKEDIEKLLRKRRDVKIGSEDFQVSTPDAILNQVNNVLNGIQIFILIIAFISIFIGSIGIVNTMTTSVLERRKEIGIMKAIGARNSQIFMLFLIESGLLGLVGGIFGVTVGLLIGYFGTVGINNFIGTTTSPSMNIPLIICTLIGSSLIGAISGIAPAMSAAKQNPVEVLRK